jgi:RHS repeat-associated protein
MGMGYIEEQLPGISVDLAAAGTSTVRMHLKDHLGSVLGVVDGSGTVLQRMSYDAWGRRRQTNGVDDNWGSLGTIANNQDNSGYTGHEHLDQLGLVHMNARLYDPILGRHTSADPTVPDPQNGQAFNRYSYVLNNALAFTDPTGLSPTGDSKLQEHKQKLTLSSPCAFAGSFCSSVQVSTPEESGGSEQTSGNAKEAPSEGEEVLRRASDREKVARNCSLAEKGCGEAQKRDIDEREQRQALGNFDKDIIETVAIPIKAIGILATLGKYGKAAWGLTFSESKLALKSAQEAYKGTTVVGHSLSKHAGRHPETWGQMTGSPKTWNEQGMTHLRDVFRGPGHFAVASNDKGIFFLEKRLSDGRGVRLNMDSSFKGFID